MEAQDWALSSTVTICLYFSEYTEHLLKYTFKVEMMSMTAKHFEVHNGDAMKFGELREDGVLGEESAVPVGVGVVYVKTTRLTQILRLLSIPLPWIPTENKR